MATVTVQRPNPAIESVTLVLSEREARALLNYLDAQGDAAAARLLNESVYAVEDALDKAIFS